MAVTVTQLVAFLTVARRGLVTAAADELVVTQPTVSAAINALQKELGVTLMHRNGRSLQPTAAGEAYLPYASSVLGLLDQGARAAAEAATSAPTLRVAAVTTAGDHLVAPLLRLFREAHPDLELILHVGNRDDVFRRLTRHEVDVGITGRMPADLPLEGRPFAANPFVLVTEPGDPLAGTRPVAIQELAGRHWLVREPGSGTRRLVLDYLAEHALEPEIVTLGSNGAIKQAAQLGLGVALVSRCTVELELELGKLALIRVRGGLPQRSWHVVHSSVGPVRAEVSAFVDFVGSRAAQHALVRAGAPAAG